MLAYRLTFAILLLAIGIYDSWQTEILSKDQDICRLFKDGVKMRKPGFCTKTIQCTNHASVDLATCTGTFPSANTKGACVKSSSDAYCKGPCVSKSPTFVTDPKNCEGWYQCSGAKEVLSGYCPSGMDFDPVKQACVYNNLSTCEAKYEVCDVAPPNEPYKDELNCDLYYQCESTLSVSKPVSYPCPTGKYFEADTATCVPKAQVSCAKYPYPENVCGTKKLAIRNRFVSDGATCRGYFYCKDKGSGVPDTEPHWGQCEIDKFFNEDLQICLTRTHVKCNEDRCDGRESGKELSQKYGCQNYLVCQNNATQVEESCGADFYFDPSTETCTGSRSTVPICN